MVPVGRSSGGDLGIGVGLRGPHVATILRDRPAVGFFEIISENYMACRGPRMEALQEIAASWPVVLHGVSLSIGSADPLDRSYLGQLAALADTVRAPFVSDHLCWTGVGGVNSHDLLPLPLTETVLAHVADRVREVADRLGRPFLLENPSAYATFRGSVMPEQEFLARLAERADCDILLDVNNVYVSAFNQGFDPEAYVDALPAGRIAQVHLAGHVRKHDHLLDTHSRPVADAVWALYDRLIRRIGPRPVILEWDADLPPFETLWAEALRADRRHVEAAP